MGFSIGTRLEQAKGAVRSDMIVIMPPVVDHYPAFAQRVDEFPVKALPPEPAIEALCITILPRASRINVDGFNPVVLEPTLDDLGDKLRAVIAADKFGGALLLDLLFENPQDVRSS